MACFLAPATVAIITTGMRKKIPQKYHMEWLNTMLWGGVVMLAVEHFTHGEITLYPPFLTAMQNPADIPTMLHELATMGGAMTIAIFAVWTIMVLTVNIVEKIREKKNLTLIK
ncbi:MAG: hypothetical protein PHY40_02095 [Patescibacteria group bacterium]|nr:hypothetical protein [Patescibacteria group bacterium]